MKSSWIVWLSCVALTVTCWEHSTADALKSRLAARDDAVLVAFVSPSGSETQALGNEWLSAFSPSDSSLLSINCDAEPSVCAEYEVNSHPTLRVLQRGNTIATYLGPLRSPDISNFLSRLARPIVSEVSTDSIDAVKGIDDTVFVAYIGPDNHAAREAFESIARKYRAEFTFGLVPDATITKEWSSVSPTIVCHLKEGGTVTTRTTSFTDSGALEKFVLEASRPVVGELTRYNQQRLLDRGWPMVYLFAKTEDERSGLRTELFSFAKGYYDSLTCVTVDPEHFPELPEKLGLEPGVFPSGAVHQLSTNRIYPYPRNLPVDSHALQKWGLDVWQGRIKPWTPPAAAVSPDSPGPTKRAKRKISLANIPGVTIKIAGHDEL